MAFKTWRQKTFFNPTSKILAIHTGGTQGNKGILKKINQSK